MPPKPEGRADWFARAIKVAIGAIFGAPLGLYFAMSVGSSDVAHISGLLGGALLFGVLSGWYGRRFWEAVAGLRWFVP